MSTEAEIRELSQLARTVAELILKQMREEERSPLAPEDRPGELSAAKEEVASAVRCLLRAAAVLGLDQPPDR